MRNAYRIVFGEAEKNVDLGVDERMIQWAAVK
jgi:hypothetical protein